MNDTLQVEETAESQKVECDSLDDNIFLSSPVQPEVEREMTVEDLKLEDMKKDEKFRDEVIEDEIFEDENQIKDENIKTDEESKTEISLNDEKVRSENEDAVDGARPKVTAFLKSLLSASTASIVPVAEKMITTTEVTDEKLNLKKILYQPDKEKKDSSSQLNSTNDTQVDDDDRRLVIDISDEEKDGGNERAINGKSMPPLDDVRRSSRAPSLETTNTLTMRFSRQSVRSQSSELNFYNNPRFVVWFGIRLEVFLY